MAKQRKLAADVQRAIVCALACYDTPTTVAEMIKEDFNIVVSPQQVESYNPERHAGRALSKKWRDIFKATREEFLKETGAIGIANKAVRLRMLDRMARQTLSQGNKAMTLAILDQAARESGNGKGNSSTSSGGGGNSGGVHVHINGDDARL